MLVTMSGEAFVCQRSPQRFGLVGIGGIDLHDIFRFLIQRRNQIVGNRILAGDTGVKKADGITDRGIFPGGPGFSTRLAQPPKSRTHKASTPVFLIVYESLLSRFGFVRSIISLILSYSVHALSTFVNS